MRYFHDAENKTVCEIDFPPLVTKDSRGGWLVTADEHITRSDNYEKENGQMAHKCYWPHHETYEAKDSQAKVVSFFEGSHRPRGVEITKEEYDRLRDLYQTEIGKNNARNKKR